MPVTKLCRRCKHIKVMHHTINGKHEGSCSVGGCSCTAYENTAEVPANGGIIPDVNKRIRDLERNMRQFQLELQQLKAQVRAD